MKISLNQFIRSLRSDRSTFENPVIPEGTCDLSHIADPLSGITRYGRPLHSDTEYSLAEFIGNFLAELAPEEATKEQLESAIMTVVLLLIHTFDAAVTLHGDTSAEELLMLAVGRDKFKDIKELLGSTPLVVDTDGSLRPNIAALPVFARARRKTKRMLDGFVRRHLVPTLPDLFTDEDQDLDTSDTPRFHTEKSIVVVDPADMGDLEVDELDGWDDEYDHFMANQFKAYENGADLDDLLGEHASDDRHDPEDP